MRSTHAWLLFSLSPLSLAIVAASLSTTGTASAQARPNAIPASNGSGLDTHLFRPALDSRGLISVNGVDVLPAGRISLGLTMDYGHGILRVPDIGQQSTALVNDSFTGTFHFNYGIADRAVVGISAPAQLMSGDPQPGVAGWGPQALDSQSIGNVALHGKLKLTRAGSGLGVAIAAQVGVPVSDAPRNAGADPSLWYWPMMIFEKRFGSEEQLRLAANMGYRGHAASTTTLALRNGTVHDGSRMTYGAGASLRIFDPLDLVAETYGTYLLGDSDAAVRPSNEALGGIKLFVDKSSHLLIGAGPRYTNGFEAADLRAVIGFVFEPPAYDSDGDGIPDGEDACPNTPGIHSGDHTKNGCPLDSDDDGIPDSEDACPLVKGPRTNNPRTNGCPPLPATPPPPPNDRDNDGVPDVEDACPDLPGKRHPDPERNGCPDIVFGPTTMTVFDKILFKTGSAEILPESNPILDKVATALNEHPEILSIEVAGHADERGSERLNLTLTQARVDSVMVALVARNVERPRLRARGYGYYCPRDEGHDEEAWSKNRRVEFLILKTTQGPTGAPIGCPNATAHGVPPLPVP
ncbi:MAG: OmpA-OmpF porin, family [Myxococcales bacterium]|nr:OmpA-OmpF porin, family [Myxococcales bacterium]